MTTIYDIARHAGVSHMTVSRVMNNSGPVSEETRKKVLEAIAELGYYPNDLARGLNRKRMRSIAIIIPDVTNPFYTTVARGVEDAARRHEFSVILCNTDDDVSCESAYLELVLRKQVDGILLASAGRDAVHLEMLLRAKVPFVLLDRRLPGLDADVVRADSYGGSQEAMKLLLTQGHSRIALVSGPLHLDSMNERYRGYCDALNAANVGCDSRWIGEGPATFRGGRDLCQQLLMQDSSITAFLCANSFIGLGVHKRLQELGRRVPADCSLVVFDELIEEYWRTFPYFTTVSQPAHSFGAAAIDLLFRRLNDGAAQEKSEIVLPTQLIQRHTTSPPQAEDAIPSEAGKESKGGLPSDDEP